MRADLAIATITLVREPGEASLLEAGVRRLSQLGPPVFVTDGGSVRGFVERIATLPNVAVGVSTHGAGLVPQVKTSLDAARRAGATHLAYTEPDKLAFFDRGFPELLAGVREDAAVLTIAAREARAFGTFPPFQQHTERAINGLTSRLTGVDADFSYGPFVMPASLVPYVVELPGDLGWGWRQFVFGLAPRLGIPLQVLAGDFECPEDQRREDARDHLHRLGQLEQNCRGLLLSQTVPPHPE